MKRSGKAQPPPAVPAEAPPATGRPAGRAGPAGGARPPSGLDEDDRGKSRPDAVESVAGEEDPGSALEQFSDLMHGSPVQDSSVQGSPEQGGPAPKAPASRPAAAGARQRSGDGEAEPPPALQKGRNRRA